MPKSRTDSDIAVGKLISAIQKEWGSELGESSASISEQVMGMAHELLQARSATSICKLLNGRTVTQHLGELWVSRHPSVVPYITELERILKHDIR